MPIPRRQVTSKTLRITFKGFEERDIEGFVQVLQWARPSMDLEFQDLWGFVCCLGLKIIGSRGYQNLRVLSG